MPKYHFQAVIDALSHLHIQRMHENELSHNDTVIIHTHAFIDQTILVSKSPKNAEELAQYLQTTLFDSKVPIGSIVAVTTDRKLTGYITQDKTQVGQFRIVRKADDFNQNLSFFAPPQTNKYELTVTNDVQATKNITSYLFPINSHDSILTYEHLIPNVYHLFQELKEENNIAFYSSSIHKRVIPIVLALCLLADFNELFKNDNPEQIAYDIIERMYLINRSSGLCISREQIIDAVRLADIIFTMHPKDFMLPPQCKVKPYTGYKLDTEDGQEELLPKDRTVRPRKKGLTICRLV